MSPGAGAAAARPFGEYCGAVTSRRFLAAFMTLACCKTPSQAAPQTPAADDGDRRADEHDVSPMAEKTPRESDDLRHRVCTRLAELAKKDPTLPPVLMEEYLDVDLCLAETVKERARDPEWFDKSAACVLQETSLADVRRCIIVVRPEGREVPDDEWAPPEAADGLRRACEKMLRFAQAGSMPEKAPDEFIDECMLDLPRMIGTDLRSYERVFECTDDARDIWEFAECIT